MPPLTGTEDAEPTGELPAPPEARPADPPAGPPAGPPAEQPAPRRRRWRRILLISGLSLVVLLAGCLVGVGLYLHSVESSVHRVDAFNDVPPAGRPPKVASDAENMLILGSDTRDPQNTTGSRSDTMILAHFPKDRGSAQLVSIPRDTWLHIPQAKDSRYGNQDAKINAAMAWGGIPLVVQTVESYTDVRIDHVVVVDFSGFKEIIDALGGVDIYVDQSFTSKHSLNPDGRRQFNKGLQHMDGAAALDYSRERYVFADGDFTRIKHQQQMIKAVLDKAASGGLLTDPGRLNSFLRATANAVAVDNTLDIFDTAMQLRHLRSGDLKFFTSPSAGTGMVGDQSVVLPDTAKAKTLFDAIRRDVVADILAAGS
jgi:LCP family protein required for cell wall assembly